MTEKNPAVFLQAGSHPAEDVRRMMDALLGQGHSGYEGVLGTGDMAVTESGTPGMSVVVASGRAWIQGDEGTYQGVYFVENRGATTLSIAASSPTNPRIDRVVAEVDDAAYSGAVNAWALKVIEGTPAGSPVAPAVPDNAISLATVAVAALASSITNANITDTRRSIRNPGYEKVIFTSSGTFTKANYPWAKAVRIRGVGGGGGGAGAATTGSAAGSVGSGGGGGGYCEVYRNIADLGTTVTVTIGAGGTGGNGVAGTAGGNTAAGLLFVAGGGAGGTVTAVTTYTQSATNTAAGGSATGGDINVVGGNGEGGHWVTADFNRARGGFGGSTVLGSAAPPGNANSGTGVAGRAYGGGGSGGSNAQSQGATRVGGNGAPGVVIVELFG